MRDGLHWIWEKLPIQKPVHYVIIVQARLTGEACHNHFVSPKMRAAQAHGRDSTADICRRPTQVCKNVYNKKAGANADHSKRQLRTNMVPMQPYRHWIHPTFPIKMSLAIFSNKRMSI